jgi:hypothetical protein
MVRIMHRRIGTAIAMGVVFPFAAGCGGGRVAAAPVATPSPQEWRVMSPECPELGSTAASALGVRQAGKPVPAKRVDDAAAFSSTCNYLASVNDALPLLAVAVEISGSGGGPQFAEDRLKRRRALSQSQPGTVVEDVSGVGDAALVALDADVVPRMLLVARSSNAIVYLDFLLDSGPSGPVDRVAYLEAKTPTLAAAARDVLAGLRP